MPHCVSEPRQRTILNTERVNLLDIPGTENESPIGQPVSRTEPYNLTDHYPQTIHLKPPRQPCVKCGGEAFRPGKRAHTMEFTCMKCGTVKFILQPKEK